MLRSVLDEQITTKVVRLGSRSSDEVVAEYNLAKLERLAEHSSSTLSTRREYAIMKEAEERLERVTFSIQLPQVSSQMVNEFLDIHYIEHADALETPPRWISEFMKRFRQDEEANGEWSTTERGGRKRQTDPELMNGSYGFWSMARDLEFLEPPSRGTDNDNPDPRPDFFASLGYQGMPSVPTSSRNIDSLLFGDIPLWSMSRFERRSLADHWEEEIRQHAYASNMDEFEEVKRRYLEACQNFNDVKDQVSAFILLTRMTLSDMGTGSSTSSQSDGFDCVHDHW